MHFVEGLYRSTSGCVTRTKCSLFCDDDWMHGLIAQLHDKLGMRDDLSVARGAR